MSLIYVDSLEEMRLGNTNAITLTFPSSGVFGGKCASIEGVTTNRYWQLLCDDDLGMVALPSELTVGFYHKVQEKLGEGFRFLVFRFNTGSSGGQALAFLSTIASGNFLIGVGENSGDESNLKIVATSSQAIHKDNWYFIEFSSRLTISGADTIVDVSLRMNNVLVASGSHTLVGENKPTFNRLRFGGGRFEPDLFDEFYISDVFEDWQGDQRLRILRPDANGNSQDWTPNSGTDHFDRINEASKDDDTSYLHTSFTEQHEMNEHDDLSDTVVNVKGVQEGLYVKNLATRTVGIISGTRQNGSNFYNGQRDFPTSASYSFGFGMMQLNPETGLVWTPTEVNENQFGFKSV